LRSRRSSASLSLCAVAAAFALASCTRVLFQANDAGGTGGDQGLGGVGGDDVGGVGGDNGLGGIGAGGSGQGGSGAGGSSLGGSGAGGSGVDAGIDTGPPDTGQSVGTTPFAPGQLVITEIMADSNVSSDDFGEWFELYNPSTTETYDLYGCILNDTSNQDPIMQHIAVHPGDFVTMARFGTTPYGTTSGGFLPNYDYHTTVVAGTTLLDPMKDVKFSNSGDRVGITCGLAQIDAVNFSTWTIGALVPHGRSYSLDPSHYNAVDNDIPDNWCTGTVAYTASDFATPLHTNTACACMLLTTPCQF
jgi:hypothetical protein